MIICKKPVPPINHLQEAGQSGHSFARGPAHFFNCLIQSNDLEGWFCGPQIHCITCRAPVTTRCFGCFLSLMTGGTLKCKQFSCDLADEKVKNWGPQNVPPSFTEFETLEGAIKERCRGRRWAWGTRTSRGRRPGTLLAVRAVLRGTKSAREIPRGPPSKWTSHAPRDSH